MRKYILVVFVAFYLVSDGNCDTLKKILPRPSVDIDSDAPLPDQINKLRQYSQMINQLPDWENFKFGKLIQHIPENLTLFDAIEKYLVPEYATDYYEKIFSFLFEFSFTNNMVQCLIDQLENTKVLNECVMNEEPLIALFGMNGNANKTLSQIDNLLDLQLKKSLISFLQQDNIQPILDFFGVRYLTNCLIEKNDSTICLRLLLRQFNLNLPFLDNLNNSVLNMNLRQIFLLAFHEYNLEENVNYILILFDIINDFKEASNEVLYLPLRYLVMNILESFYLDHLIDGSIDSLNYLINCGLLEGNVTKWSDFEACFSKYPKFYEIYLHYLDILRFYSNGLRYYSNEFRKIIWEVYMEISEMFLRKFDNGLITQSDNLLDKLNI